MGISGLLQSLKSLGQQVHVSEFKGQKVGVDVYSWLHKGAIGCAADLCQKIPTCRYITYVMDRVHMLQHFKVHPVLIFDGGNLPLKRITESERRQGREHHMQEGMTLLRQGKRASADDHFQKACDVTVEMACSLIQVLRQENVEFYVAPYEADAQLAFLARNGYVSCIITEDSDLIALETPCTLFKMDKFGTGTQIRFEDLARCDDMSFLHFTPEMVLTVCIMAGCDYLPSLSGIGFKTAYKLVKQHKTIKHVLNALQVDPKGKFSVRELSEYAIKFNEAALTFRHHRVYDPWTRSMVTLTPVPEEVDADEYTFLGPPLDLAQSRSVCEGHSDPYYFIPYPVELRADVRKYNSLQNRSRDACEAAPLTQVPMSPVEMANQPTISCFFETIQSTATRAPFKPPRNKSTVNADMPSDTLLRVAKRRKIIRVSRFFNILDNDDNIATTQLKEQAQACNTLMTLKGDAVQADNSSSWSTLCTEVEEVRSSTESPVPNLSPNTAPPSPVLCPNATPGCIGKHGIFFNCVKYMQAVSELGPPPPEIPDLCKSNDMNAVQKIEVREEHISQSRTFRNAATKWNIYHSQRSIQNVKPNTEFVQNDLLQEANLSNASIMNPQPDGESESVLSSSNFDFVAFEYQPKSGSAYTY
jgi:exonuclease-1